MTEYYVVVKLVSGEEVMAMLENEDESYIELYNPITIRTIPIIEEGREHVLTTPLCQFTEDESFVISKKHVLYIKQLKAAMIPHYHKVLQSYAKAENFRPVDAFDGEDISEEEALKRIAMLAEVFGDQLESELEEKEEKPTLLEGNDTIH